MATDFNTQLAALIEAYTGLKVPADQLLTGQFTYLSGTLDDPDSFDADGKPATDPTHGPLGYYPLLNGSGATAYVPCLRRVAALASGAAPAFAAEAEASADAAAASETAAAASATSAAGSATTATTKASEAASSATAAAGSATTANTKANQAASSASVASTKAADSEGYASTAAFRASEAASSATAAAGSATAAANSATAAAASAAIADRAAGGSENQVQYNVGGVLTGSNGLVFSPSAVALGIGVTSLTGYGLRLGMTLTASGGYSNGIYSAPVVPLGATLAMGNFTSAPIFIAGLAGATLNHYRAEGVILQSGASIQYQNGFSVSSGMSNGTAGNYGFTSDLAANGTKNWSLYFGLDAPSYMAGGLSLGAVSNPGAGNLRVAGRVLVSDTSAAAGAEVHVRKSTGDVNLSLQSDASGTAYINLIGPLVAYGGLRASNGTGEEWRIGGLGSAGTFGISLGGTTRFNINSQSVTVGAASAPGIAFRVGGVMESTDRAQASAFVPTGSSIPTNGLYLSAANVLGLSINSAQAFLLGATSASFTGTGYDFRITATGANNVGSAWRRNGVDIGYVGNGGYGLSGVSDTDFAFNAQAGALVLGTQFAERGRLTSAGLQVTGSVQATGTLRPGSFTVATLPSASAAGDGAIARVSDANSTTFRAVVAGGGSNKINVCSDGANWRIGA